MKEYERYRLVRLHSAAAALAAMLFGLLLFVAGRLPFSPSFYHSIHLALGLAAVVVCWLVAVQGWAVFPHTLSMERLVMGALFFSSGTLFSFHFLLSFSDVGEASLFSLAARFTLAWGLLFLFSRPDEVMERRSGQRWQAFLAAFAYTVAVGLFIHVTAPLWLEDRTSRWPLWWQAGEGAVGLLDAAAAALVWRRYGQGGSPALLYWLMALLLFAFGQVLLLLGNGHVLWGQLYEVAGFLYVVRAMYVETIEKPYVELKQHKQQLEMMANALGEGLMMLDRDGQIVWMNPEAGRLIGVVPEEAKGKPLFSFVSLAGPDGSAWDWKRLRRVVKQLKSGEVIRVEEEPFRRHDGVCLPVGYTLAPVMENGALTGLVAVLRDMTEKKEKERLEREREQLDFELSLAANMQRALLQTSSKADLPSYVDISVLSVPARVLSGDFYHFAVHQTSVSVGIADVSGKGIPAAMLMTLMKFILDRTVHYGTQPHVYLDLLNRFAYDYTEPSMFVTMFVGNYNEKTHTFSYACAGHEPALWYRAKTKQCVPLHAKGCALGLFPQFSFETKSVVLEPGDFVLLYTDGVTEKRGEEADDDFSVLASMVARVNLDQPAAQIVRDLYEHIKAYHQYEQKDDQTLLLLRRR
ncbi:SpoIIE family protein phosphatase [Geobacillus stearothermophilus]|uniref:SpoIIE family protein phosphatase n=1 Tax=Geobacillus stearothermophilus TaxID=1422 RepID=UPI002402A514|nr:SpoIIE family protein phosphatase [Geobacillus stearothermophilus]MDF9298426.1 SpoIIE family protein phosphatase [Geobacillus stearothermophilus]